MDLYILSESNLDRLGIIDNASSIIWNKKYFSCGDFSFNVQATEYTIELIKKNRFVTRNGLDEIGIIETISLKKDTDNKKELFVSGRFAQSVLSRRVIWGESLLNGQLLNQLYGLIDVNAINPIDENGEELPERKLVTPERITSFLGTVYDNPQKKNVNLKSIQADIQIINHGQGSDNNYLYETIGNYELGTGIHLITDNNAYSFGDLVKNYKSGVGDSVFISGNKFYIQKLNRYYPNVAVMLKAFFVSAYRQIAEWNTYKDYNTTYQKPIFLNGGLLNDTDLAIFCDVEQFPFSNIFEVKPERDGSTNKYIYQQNKCLCFANFINLNDYYSTVAGQRVFDDISFFNDLQTRFDELIEQMEQLNGFIIWTRESKSISDSGITITDIETNSSKYELISNGKETNNVSLMLLEIKESDPEATPFFVLNQNFPQNNSVIYEIVKGNNLLDFVEKTLQKIGLGIKADYNYQDKKIYLSFYSGQNRTRNQQERKQIVFSQELDSLLSYELTETTQGKYNIARISGKKNDSVFWTQTGASAGLDRNEVYDDVGDLGQFSEIDHILAMQNSGELALQGFSTAIDSEIFADSYNYRQDYDVGDIVTIDIKDLSLQYNIRILEVCESYDANGYKITLILGE